MTKRPRLRWIQHGLLVAGFLLLGLWSRNEILAHEFQAVGAAKLVASKSGATPGMAAVALRPATDVRPAARQARVGAGDVLGRLEIPRLRIAAIVAEGVDAKTLGRAIGHIEATARPGEPGNCALAGHRDTFLRGLGNVRVDDAIRIVTRDRTYLYQVEWTEVVEPRRIDVLYPTPERSVTLVTCYPFQYVGHAPKRFIVRARQVDAIAAIVHEPDSDPAGRP
jgi:LPXTG-site transpeptidase (sortase) family protein